MKTKREVENAQTCLLLRSRNLEWSTIKQKKKLWGRKKIK